MKSKKKKTTGFRLGYDRATQLQLHTLMLPGTVLMLLFSIVPLFGLLLAFKNYSVIEGIKGVFTSPWYGFQNFKVIFGNFDFKRMLDRVTFPLTTAQISEFVLDKEYTNFLTLQTAISELMETGLAESRTILNRTQLQITDEGRDTLHYFENRISDAIKSDIIDYFKNHKLELRNESSIQGNFYKLVNGEFEAQLVAKDKDVDLVNIRISVPTQELAASICANWQKKNKEIYQYLTEQLF